MTLDRTYFRYALRLALGCFVVVFIYELLHLKNGYWAAFSVLGCVFPTVGQAMKRSKQRIIGTFVGMILGIVIATVFGRHWLYLDIVIPICVFLTVYLKAFSYSFYALFNTIISVLLICLLSPGDWQVACVRMEMTAWGVLMAILVTYLILPTRASDELPALLHNTQECLQKYYDAVQQSFLAPRGMVLQNIQLQVFDQLQKTMAVLQESRHESWPKKSRHDDPYQKQYEMLQNLYQSVLLLEASLPDRLTEPPLQTIAAQLKIIMAELTNVFYSNPQEIEPLLQRLNDNLQAIQVLRVEAVRDPSIPMATFREHIQLMDMVEQLLLLLKILRSGFSTPVDP
jgi:uncharacterized membrane protein YccC